MVKKIVYILVLLFLFVLLFSLSKQLFDTLETGNRLEREEQELKNLKQKNQELQKTLQEVDSVNFIESQARDKLNMSRGEETIIIIPQSEIDKVYQAQKPPEPIKLPNWQAWLNLFLR